MYIINISHYIHGKLIKKEGNWGDIDIKAEKIS